MRFRHESLGCSLAIGLPWLPVMILGQNSIGEPAQPGSSHVSTSSLFRLSCGNLGSPSPRWDCDVSSKQPNPSEFLLRTLSSCSNPQFTADEIYHQLRIASVTFMVVDSTVLDVSLEAARLYGLPDDRIILLDAPKHTLGTRAWSTQNSSMRESVADLINKGLHQPCCFVEPELGAGEGKTRVALLSWSSGTTGTPKVGIKADLYLRHTAGVNFLTSFRLLQYPITH